MITRFWVKKKSNYNKTDVWASPNPKMEIRKKRSTKINKIKKAAKVQPHGWRASRTAGELAARLADRWRSHTAEEGAARHETFCIFNPSFKEILSTFMDPRPIIYFLIQLKPVVLIQKSRIYLYKPLG